MGNSMNDRPLSTMTALGLMSGTSRDGVDAAIVRTDGISVLERGPSMTAPYDREFRKRLADLIDGRGNTSDVEVDLTARHADIIENLLQQNSITFSEIDIIGFHGHTIIHAPEVRRTLQIGDGERLARTTGVTVVNDFRSADVAAGGQGAPLAPTYHWALARKLPKPLAVLNLGGVANVTWIGEVTPAPQTSEMTGTAVPEIRAFDTGPGNALLDDWVGLRTGDPFDRDGALASRGRSNAPALKKLMNHPYFSRLPPKSLDRDAFSLERWLVAGGGRHNRAVMDELAARIGAPVEPVEAVDGTAAFWRRKPSPSSPSGPSGNCPRAGPRRPELCILA